MIARKNDVVCPLFRSVSSNGIVWLFLTTDQSWAITRDGTEIASGSAERASIDSGVRQFRALTSSVAATSEEPGLSSGQNKYLHDAIGQQPDGAVRVKRASGSVSEENKK